MSIYLCIYIYIYVYICIYYYYIGILVHSIACCYVSFSMYTHTRTHTHIHIYIYIYIYNGIHTYTHIYVYLSIYLYIYIYIVSHAHTTMCYRTCYILRYCTVLHLTISCYIVLHHLTCCDIAVKTLFHDLVSICLCSWVDVNIMMCAHRIRLSCHIRPYHIVTDYVVHATVLSFILC